MKFWIDPISFFFYRFIDKIDRVRLFKSTLWKFLRPIGFVAIYFRNYPPSTGLILFFPPLLLLFCLPSALSNRSWKKSIFIHSHKFVSRLYDLLELWKRSIRFQTSSNSLLYAERVISTSILSARALGPRENVCSFPLPTATFSSPSIVSLTIVSVYLRLTNKCLMKPLRLRGRCISSCI